MGDRGAGDRWTAAWPWFVAAGGTVLLLGPLLGARALLGFDLAAFDELRVPPGTWGLGSVIPRRGLWFVPAAAASKLLGGPTVLVLVVAASLVAAFVGVERLSRPAPAVCRAGAGVLYAFGPFMATRIGVGHLSLVLATGLLPWALPTLLDPGRDLRRTFRWALALAFAGPFGGAFAVLGLAAGVATGGRRRFAGASVGLLAQLPWVLPAAIVTLHPADGGLSGSATFATDADGPAGWLALFAGRGFWEPSHQIGPAGWLAAALGATVLALAVAGRRPLHARHGRGPELVASVALFFVVASALPGIATPWDWLTAHTPIAAVREGHRLLPLVLVWVAPSAALGAHELAGRAPRLAAVPLAVGLVLAGPGLWGSGGGLRVIDLPASWAAARELVADQPGPVVVLPRADHLDLALADGRRVVDPLPDLLGGDVIAGTDESGGQEGTDRTDRRSRVVPRALANTDEPISSSLAGAGVRWVAVLTDATEPALARRLASDRGLELEVEGDGLALYRVGSWSGPAIDDDGRAVDVREHTPFYATLDDERSATWSHLAGWGWLHGVRPVAETEAGALRLHPGGGPVWYWPAFLIIGTDVMLLLIAASHRIPGRVS